MAGILLGSMTNKNDIKYGSNMEGNIRAIERNQARQDFSKPEYLNQFDDLRFDNVSNPVGENDTYNTLLGLNSSVRKNLEIRDNYSYFNSNENGTYNVVPDNQLTHNNMMPNTTQRDVNKSVDFSQRKLEAFTGSNKNLIQKKEKVPLFEPMKDLSWVHGAPVMSGELQQRYLPSNKNNNGNLPFENKVRVLPGLGNQVQEGRNAVYRMNPVNVDKLRSNINQKVSYENKPLETIKKGEMRGPDFNLTKFKLPDFRETDFGDLIPNCAVVPKEKKEGIYTNMHTDRGDKEIYMPGPGIMISMGDGPDLGKTKFATAKKETFMNDNERNIQDVNNKPVFTNIKSWTNDDNQRASTNYDYKGPVQYATTTYSLNYNDIAKKTIKETTSHDIVSNFTNVNSNPQYIKNNDMAKNTIKQTTSHDIVSNFSNVNSNPQYLKNNDMAKTTIKQMTSHDTVSNFSNVNSNPQYLKNNDTAKTTIKQMTSHDTVSNFSNVNSNPQYLKNNDTAKTTIKQMTSHNIVSNFNSVNANSQYLKNNDTAKMTTKQMTSHNIVSNVNSIHSNSQYLKNNDVAKPTMKENVEATKYIGIAGDNFDNATYTQLEDTMRPTIKQSTSVPVPVSNIYMSSGVNYSRNPEDKTRDTIKQTIINNNYIGNIKNIVEGGISHVASSNMHQNLCREKTTYNRPANAKSDQMGPMFNKETFEPNQPLLYGYTGNAHRGLDQTVMATLSREEILNINEIRTNSKPIIDTSTYYINNNFINTLKDNPYVNDLYHQKNLTE